MAPQVEITTIVKAEPTESSSASVQDVPTTGQASIEADPAPVGPASTPPPYDFKIGPGMSLGDLINTKPFTAPAPAAQQAAQEATQQGGSTQDASQVDASGVSDGNAEGTGDSTKKKKSTTVKKPRAPAVKKEPAANAEAGPSKPRRVRKRASTALTDPGVGNSMSHPVQDIGNTSQNAPNAPKAPKVVKPKVSKATTIPKSRLPKGIENGPKSPMPATLKRPADTPISPATAKLMKKEAGQKSIEGFVMKADIKGKGKGKEIEKAWDIGDNEFSAFTAWFSAWHPYHRPALSGQGRDIEDLSF
ncbi:uncharacterized protein PAC_14749 [Phialocephala subalpina]|uniref:Uncharacterized protein n=1 Tax=Phialocephala subalpina TaxID=576137 RepID=A0A1L7XII9_9HELO|nr:uncharacterized protein PAC_14749 [Phialocephala subalpina]